MLLVQEHNVTECKLQGEVNRYDRLILLLGFLEASGW